MWIRKILYSGVLLAVVQAGCNTPHPVSSRPGPATLKRPEPAAPAFQRPAASVPSPESVPLAGSVLTLRRARNLALARNPNLEVFSWKIRAKEARVLQAGLYPNPEIEVEMENLAGTRSMRRLNGTESTVLLSQPFELGGKRAGRKRVASLERELADWDYETSRLEVLAEVDTAFIEVLAAQERVALAKEMVSLAEEAFDIVSERVSAGKVSPLEETKAGIALSTSRIELAQALRTLDEARVHLSSTWGESSPSFEGVTGKLDSLSPLPPEGDLAALIPRNPDMARWVVEKEHRLAGLELEKSKRYPDLTLNAGFRRFNESNSNAFVLGFSIPLPFFDRNQGGTLEARSRLSMAGKEQRTAELRIIRSLAEAYRSLSTAHAEASSLNNDVIPGARHAFAATREGYRQGKYGYLDVLDSQRTLFEARSRYVDALERYHKAAARTARLTGNTERILDK